MTMVNGCKRIILYGEPGNNFHPRHASAPSAAQIFAPLEFDTSPEQKTSTHVIKTIYKLIEKANKRKRSYELQLTDLRGEKICTCCSRSSIFSISSASFKSMLFPDFW